MNLQSIKINGNNFTLHPLGVFFWKEKSMLLISDVHLGKVSHFRKFGAAVPQRVIQENFVLMNDSIRFFQPEVIVFMGDLFHSSLNREWQLFEKWRKTIAAKIILVVGNHDIIAPTKYEELGIRVTSEIQLDGFLLTHHPEEREGFYNFSGHIHPAIRLKGNGRQTLKLSCFFQKPKQLILPAFGQFTGTHVLKPQKNDTVYAIAEQEVFLVYE